MSTTTNLQAFEKKIYKQVGFSLIEVMVTLVILSFGLLGISVLLVKGISNSSSSESMSKANLLVADMADRIRANPAVAKIPHNEYLRNYEAPMSSSSHTIAQNDMNEWLKSLQAQLPQGDGEITLDSSTLVIGVRWSNCIGTLSTADREGCKNKSDAAFKSINYELRL